VQAGIRQKINPCAAGQNQLHFDHCTGFPPDTTTSHSTKLANNASQVAGYPTVVEGANAELHNFLYQEQSHA